MLLQRLAWVDLSQSAKYMPFGSSCSERHLALGQVGWVDLFKVNFSGFQKDFICGNKEIWILFQILKSMHRNTTETDEITDKRDIIRNLTKKFTNLMLLGKLSQASKLTNRANRGVLCVNEEEKSNFYENTMQLSHFTLVLFILGPSKNQKS